MTNGVGDELEVRLAAARAKRDELEAKRAERDATRAKLAEVEKAEREAKEAEVLDRLECEHGPVNEKIRPVYTPGGLIVVKRAQSILVRRYMDHGKADSESWDKLVRPCVLYPEKAEFNRIVEDYPASLQKCADAVCWLAGWGRKDLEGKVES
jgi:hypothetical protein